VPFVKLATVIGELAPVAVIVPGDDVTVYDVMALPPLLAGAVKETEACALPAVAVTPVGASGTVPETEPMVIWFVDSVWGPVPAALVAATLNV
jgi:hypothetical protein